MNDIQLEASELEAVKELKKSYSILIVNLGQYNLEKVMLEKKIDELKTELDKVLLLESTISTDLNKKYGTGFLDLESGVFKKN